MKRIFSILVLAVALSIGTAGADPIVISGSTAYSTNYTGAFFNHPSWDGNGCNVGNYIVGDGGCSAAGFYAGSPLTTLAFLGIGQTTFKFSAEPNTSVFLTGVSAHVDEFGWFELETSRSLAGPHVLFDNKVSTNTSASFTPSGAFGFYFRDTATGARWNTTELGDSQSHFALFDGGNGTYYLGMEDLRGPLGATDYDYNDAIVRIDTNPVPEPSSMILLGMGLLGMGGALRKKRKT